MIGVVFVFFVLRPALVGLARTPGPLTGAGAATALSHENLQLTQQNPERAAQLVREWLSEGGAAGGESG